MAWLAPAANVCFALGYVEIHAGQWRMSTRIGNHLNPSILSRKINTCLLFKSRLIRSKRRRLEARLLPRMPFKRPSKPFLCRYTRISQSHQHSKVFEFMIVLLRHILGVCALVFCRGVVIVEITGISCVLDFWNDRALHLSMV